MNNDLPSVVLAFLLMAVVAASVLIVSVGVW